MQGGRGREWGEGGGIVPFHSPLTVRFSAPVACDSQQLLSVAPYRF